MIFNKPETDGDTQEFFPRKRASKLIEEDIKKRRKKEPPKPWGKKERLTVLFVLLLTIGASVILAFSAREWKLPGLPRIKFPEIQLFKEEVIVIERTKKNEVNQGKINQTLSSFKQETKDLSGVYGLYVYDLGSGYSYGIYEKEVFQAASLIKLPVMITLYEQAESSKISLETKYSLKSADKVAGSGSLYSKPVGTTLTYRELLKLMGKESDNTAFRIIRNLVGDEEIKKVITDIGMTQTSLENNETSPYDIGLLFQKLWGGKLLNKAGKDELLGFLTDTIYEAWLSAGIPEDIKVAHKYGREVHVVNDAGIVFTDKPFVVVILSKGVVEGEADEVFPDLARIIYAGQVN